MGFKLRKEKYKEAEKFIVKMKEVQEEAKIALQKVQDDIMRHIDRSRREVEKYRVDDLVLLSTKDLKY